MSLSFYANPYSWELNGFYFKSLEEYNSKLEFNKKFQNSTDFECEIDLIKGTSIDHSIFDLADHNVSKFFELKEELEELNENQMTVIDHCCNELGYDLQKMIDNIQSFCIWTSRDDLETEQKEAVFIGSDIDEQSPIYVYFDENRHVEDLILNSQIVELGVDFYFDNPHWIL